MSNKKQFQKRLKPVFVSTNLTPEQMLARYDVRTIDRLVRLSKMVKFEGKSYRK
jgi:DNA replication protein DnaC